MTTTAITVQVPLEVADALDEAIEYIENRLIGRIPPRLESLLQAVAGADSRALHLVGNDGTASVGEEGTDDLSAEEEASIDSYETWLASAEGEAEAIAAERYADWKTAQGARMEADYQAWADNCATNFARARQAWWKARTAQLRTEYDSQTTK